MKKIKEEDIERYVRFPGSLSREEYAHIQQAIEDSPELAQLCHWFASYYRQVNRLSGASSREIPLFYCSSADKESRIVVLSAMSPETKSSHELHTLATFASEKEQMIVRFLQESGTDRFKLHLIRNTDPTEHELSMICMPQYDINLLVDATRHLDFESFGDFELINWQDVQLALRLPTGHVSLDPANLNTQTLAQKTGHLCGEVFLEEDESMLKVDLQLNEEAAARPVLVCQRNGQKTQYRADENEIIKIPILETDSKIHLWFFA